MSEHLSLSAKITLPPQLEPVRQMDNPYAPCWCRSGEKWKWCHKDRDKQPKINIGAQLHKLNHEMIKKGYCSHPEAGDTTCGAQIIQSHSIQRNGGLKAISEGGHVISVKAGNNFIEKNHGEIVPSKVGVRSASTFMGFCDQHDNELFKPIELGITLLNEQTALLLSFRAIAMEVFLKKAAIRAVVKIHRNSDNGLSFESQYKIQEHLTFYEHGLKMGLSDSKSWKATYDKIITTATFNSFRYYAIVFSDILPVVASGVFHPEFDFHDIALQKLGRVVTQYEHIAFNLTVLNGKSVAIFGWTHPMDGPALKFAASYCALDKHEKANAAIHLALEQLENVYFKPSWWNNLHSALHKDARKRIKSGGPGMEREANCLTKRDHQYCTADVTEELSNVANLLPLINR